METSHHLHPIMETVKMESMLPAKSQSSVLLDSSQCDVKEESIIESRSSKHGVATDKQVQTTRTVLSGKKDNSKLKVRENGLQKMQSTPERNKKIKAKKRNIRSLAMDTTLATIFSRIPLAKLIEKVHKKPTLPRR